MKKIAVFAGSPFGSLGTSGTYNIARQFSLNYRVRIFSRPPDEEERVFDPTNTPFIPFDIEKYVNNQDENLSNIIKLFNPDIIYIVNTRFWPKLVIKLKNILPESKLVLDIKTPLLTPHPEKRKKIQEEGIAQQHLLDKIVTISPESVRTWIPECSQEILVYPLGIDTRLFPKLNIEKTAVKERFIIVSSIHPFRKLDKMIQGFALYVKKENPNATLDIVGSGKDLIRLQQLTIHNGYQSFITFRGKIEQKELFASMNEYDAAIAWVPLEKYSCSPSLKILEYMAASLPVIATATEAHLHLLDEGFHFQLCDDTPESLYKGLCALKTKRDSYPDILSNNDLVLQNHDFSQIVAKYLQPVLQNLISDTKIELVKKCQVVQSKSPLKIIFCIHFTEYNIEKTIIHTAKEMARRGHIVYILYQGKKTYDIDENIILVPFIETTEMIDIILGINPSLVMIAYSNHSSLQPVISLLKKTTSIPICLQECISPEQLLSNWNQDSSDQFLYIKAWERDIICAHAARIHISMLSYKTSFRSYIQPQIRTISNPCPFHDYRADPGLIEGRKQIILIDGFNHHKEFLLLLQAFQIAITKDSDWKIIMVGTIFPPEHNTYCKEIYTFIHNYALEEHISFADSIDNVFSYYAKSQIHVIASLREACPRVVLEAMSVGLPSIGFKDCPGTEELIRHEENGLLVDGEDRVISLSETLSRLMGDAALRERLGKQALEDSLSYSKAIYDQWEQMFREAAEYKNDPDRLLREQMEITPEAALHARRMLKTLE